MSEVRSRRWAASRPMISVGVAAALVLSLVVGVPGSPASANGGPAVPFPSEGDVRVVARPVATGANFSDVSSRAYFVQATEWLAEQEITTGTAPGEFSPSRPVNRRQMGLFLHRLVGAPEPTEPCAFADVNLNPERPADVEFGAALCWMAENDITTGVGVNAAGDPLYGPSQTVTRGQMARFLWRLSGKRPVDSEAGFTDAPRAGELGNAINWLNEFSITTGTSPTTFTPVGTVTRGQMAAFLYRLAAAGDAWNPGVRVVGSVEQISVVGTPGTVVSLFGADGSFQENATLDIDGGWLWRLVEPGEYVVAVSDGEGGSVGAQVVVTGADDPPPPSTLYSGQTLQRGYNYITMRDGTQLAAFVAFPSGPGPYPTLVEYSGYDLADPYTAIGAGSSPYRLLAPQFGYALVQVQMRGSGCSGGAFDYFEPLQNLDGYDAIETVAAQRWAKPNAVTGQKAIGMVGISYPGISQLFVASSAPPSLAAITPVSVVADMARSVLRPGGILNDGFAVSWAQGAVNRGKPARQDGNPAVNGGWTGGVQYVARRIDEGDATCRLNQRLHGQQADLIGRINTSVFEQETDEYLSPMRLVGNINAPTLMVGSWQDEQTGGLWAILASQFKPETYVRLIAQNGTHAEPIMPDNIKAAFEHLAIFVKGDRPNFPVATLNALIGGVAGLLVGGGQLPPEGQLVFTESQYDNRSIYPRFADVRNDYLNLPRLTVRFDNGAGPNGGAGGSLVPAESRHFSGFPLQEGPGAEAQERTWYLRGDGSLVDSASALVSDSDESVSYDFRTAAGRNKLWTDAPGCSDWAPDPRDNTGVSCYDWRDPGPQNSASFIAAPFTSNTYMIGGGLVDLNLVWTPDGTPEESYTDVQVTLSEVRADGKEIYVQSGWVRTTYCVEDAELSLPRLPWATAREADAQDCELVAGQEVRVQVPIFPFAHIFRAGSQLRLSVDAPGGSRVLWKFVSAPDDATITLRTDVNGREASTLRLPVVTRDLTVTNRNPSTGLRTWTERNITNPRLSQPPACGVLRSQPCRTYTAPTPP